MQCMAKAKGAENNTFHIAGTSKEMLKNSFIVLKPLPYIRDIKMIRMEISKTFRKISLHKAISRLYSSLRETQ